MFGKLQKLFILSYKQKCFRLDACKRTISRARQLNCINSGRFTSILTSVQRKMSS